MERRTFCGLFSIAMAGTFLPFIGCSGADPALQRKLSLPISLATINDPTTLAELGNSYLKQVPDENSASQLVEYLLVSSTGEAIPETTDSLTLQTLLLQKVQADFQSGKTVVIRGWVLSRTEARQCALYSLTKTNI